MNQFIRLLAHLFVGALLLLGISCAQGVGTFPPALESQNIIQQSGVNLNDLEPDEVCVINANLEETKAVDQFATSRGYTKKKRRILEGLGVVMSIFQIPSHHTVYSGIAEFREAFPSLAIDANHHYKLQSMDHTQDMHQYGQQLVGWDAQALRCGVNPLQIGMIDTAIETNHPYLKNQVIQSQSFLSESIPHAPNTHGTSVAIQLVGHSATTPVGLMPNARLFAAETFRHRDATHIEATTWNIVRALDWLIQQHVQVINMSLGGPDNALLSFAVNHTLRQNISIIAAAGNLGPSGQAVYPAAQEGVIAVTALDAKLHPYRHANQGQYIALAAPGVDIWVPNGEGAGLFQSGTSFAAPFVTTAAALLKRSHPQWTPDQVSTQLANSAVDLGETGRDHVYGWGLVQIPKHC